MKIKQTQLTMKKAVLNVYRLGRDLWFPMTLAVPQYTEAEVDEAKFTATDLMAKLAMPGAGEDPTHVMRRRFLAVTFMFQMAVDGVLGELKAMIERAKVPAYEGKGVFEGADDSLGRAAITVQPGMDVAASRVEV